MTRKIHFHNGLITGFLIVLLLTVFASQTLAQAPNPLPPRDHNTAIIVMDDFGLPPPPADEGPATTAIDCLLLHTIDPGGASNQGQATRTLGMATRSLGMTNDETDIDEPHGKFVFTQFVDFADPSGYDDLTLQDYVLDAYLNGSSFERYVYPAGHTNVGQIATNPNQIEFSGYDLIPLHVPDGDSADEWLDDAVTRALALGYSDIIVNMSFGFFDCDDIDNYIADPDTAVDNVENSDLHQEIIDIRNANPEVVFVASSGNFSKNSPFAPAVWNEVISVGAYNTIDTIANLTERRLFMARNDVPQDYYANIGSILMPGAWGDITQENEIYQGTNSHRVHFEGTSFAAPWLSMFLAQYMNASGSNCNVAGLNTSLTESLTVNWSGTPEVSRNIETIVRGYTCPEMHATSFNVAQKRLNFATFGGSPNLQLNITKPIASSTVPSSFRFEGYAYDANAGTGNGPAINWVRIYVGSNCSGSWLAELSTGLIDDQPGYDVTYDFSGFGTTLNRPDGSLTLSACAQSSLDTGFPIKKQTITISVDSGATSNVCSGITFPKTVTTAQGLVNAIECANETPGTDTINLGADITLTQPDNTTQGGIGLPVVTSAIVINGNNGGNRRTIHRANGSGEFRIFYVDDGGSLILKNVVISNGSSDLSGGGIFNSGGTITIRNSVITGNYADQSGGGLSNADGTANVINSIFRDNYAREWNGGAIANGDILTIINSVITGNFADSVGGGISNFGTLTMHNTTISGNTATGVGGGLANWVGSTANVYNSIIWGNIAGTTGSQLYNSASLTLTSTAIELGLPAAGGLIPPTDGGNNLSLSSGSDVFVSPVRASGSNTPNTAGDYHLSTFSVAMDQGNNALLPADTFDLDGDANTGEPLSKDYEGDVRVIGSAVDMGADESYVVPPYNTNLLYNPQFSLGGDGESGWHDSGSIISTVTGGVLNLRFPATVNGWFYQAVAQYPLPIGLQMEATVEVSNPDNAQKQFRLLVGNNTMTNFYQCVYTVPANSPARTFKMQFPTLEAWKIIRFDIRPEQADAGGLNFDNFSLEYKPSLTVTNRKCVSFPPANTNLIYNPGFTLGVNGDAGWRDEGSITSNVTNGVMNIKFTEVEDDDDWLRQFIAAYPVPAGLSMEAKIDISNPTNVDKQFRFWLGAHAEVNHYQCVFTVPANTPMLTYTMRVPTLQEWSIIRVDLRLDAPDATGVNIDNVDLQYKPNLNVIARECISPYLPPINANLLYNGGFDIGANDDAGWRYEGNIQGGVISNKMTLNFPAAVNGWLRQFRTVYPLQKGLRMVGYVTVSNPNAVAKNFQFMMRDSDLSNTYLCNFTIPASAQNQVYYMRFKTLTFWEIIRVDLRPNVASDANGLTFDNVNLRYRPYLTFTANQECISPAPDETPTPPPETELVANDAVGNGLAHSDDTSTTVEASLNPTVCQSLDWFNTDNWKGYLPTSEVQFVFDPFPQSLTTGDALNASRTYDANGDGSADTLYDALSYNGHGHAVSLLREAVIAMLNDRYDSTHPESWWAVEIDTAEALAQGENAMLALAQRYALSNSSCK